MFFVVFALLAQSKSPISCLHKRFKHKSELIKCLMSKSKENSSIDWIFSLPDELKVKVSDYCESTTDWDECYSAMLHYDTDENCQCGASRIRHYDACKKGCDYFKKIKGQYGY